MELWTTPTSPTFGNVYQSAIKAGFSKTYSKNLLNVAPKWLLTYIDRTDFTPHHIKNGLQELATSANNSRSPDDTRLKALEILSKVTGMIDSKGSGNTTNILVQPILGGSSATDPTTNKTIIEVDNETTE